ncbi:MAG: hypothetical protein JOZ41_21000, partial [Chloroflexi bacterium]|nr:hypothetical protein [Chloroflexota bacterium]
MSRAEDEVRALRAELAQLRSRVQGLERERRDRRLVPAGRISRGGLLRGAGVLALGAAAAAVAPG